MSKGINKVILVGNLGDDPQVRYTQQGHPVATLSVATSESWRDKNTGEPREKTEWHRVSLFGKLAEVAGEYLRKGSQVYIEGQLETSKWQDQNGQDRYTTQVVVKGFNGTMQMLGSRQGGPGQGQAPQQGHQPQGGQQRMPTIAEREEAERRRQEQLRNQQRSQTGYNEPPMDFDDDIPFRLFFNENKNLHLCI